MIEEKTTFILGAGSSAHVGYPLGAGLLKNMCSIRINKNYPQLPEKWSTNDIDDLLISLSRSGHYSIDAFLESSEYRNLGKYLIAYQLKQYEVVDELFPPNESGWYQILFSSLIDQCGSDIGKNNLSIITFNYDRSLETYLHNAIQHRFKLSAEDAWDKVSEIPFVHVHGVLGEYPKVDYQPTCDFETLLSISEEIRIIHEIEDNEGGYCNSEFEAANGLLEQSERIVFLGFGFHDDNVRRFNFFTPEEVEKRNVYSTHQGMTGFEYSQMVDRLDKYGLKKALGTHHGQNCEGLFRSYLTL